MGKTDKIFLMLRKIVFRLGEQLLSRMLFEDIQTFGSATLERQRKLIVVNTYVPQQFSSE